MIIGHFYTPPADKGGLKIVSGVPRHYAHIPHHSALDFSPWRVTALIPFLNKNTMDGLGSRQLVTD
jgi:hypothetical protein